LGRGGQVRGVDAENCRRYAAECLVFAKAAESDIESDFLVEMAQLWVQAAIRIECSIGVANFLQPQAPPLAPE